jgi:hypothetical protein
MAKNRTRRGERGLVGRVTAPVGVVVNTASNIVRNVFKSVKKVGHHAVRGTNKLINSVGNSISSKRGHRATRRRKN